MISGDDSMDQEVEARIGCASRIIGGMSQGILRRRELIKQTKLRVVIAMVMPVLMYGCEACMGTTERAEDQDPSHTNECIEENRVSVLERRSHKQ